MYMLAVKRLSAEKERIAGHRLGLNPLKSASHDTTSSLDHVKLSIPRSRRQSEQSSGLATTDLSNLPSQGLKNS